MIRIKDDLLLVRLRHMLLPAFLMYIDSTFGTVINMGFGFLATDRTFHFSLPPLSFSFFFDP